MKKGRTKEPRGPRNRKSGGEVPEWFRKHLIAYAEQRIFDMVVFIRHVEALSPRTKKRDREQLSCCSHSQGASCSSP